MPVIGGISERQFVVPDDGPVNVAVWARDDEGDEVKRQRLAGSKHRARSF